MPRGRRRITPEETPLDTQNVDQLQDELEKLRTRQAELRALLRKARNSTAEVGKLEEKLDRQLAVAKHTVNEILQVKPDWNLWAFYDKVTPRKPAPRGRRPRSME